MIKLFITIIMNLVLGFLDIITTPLDNLLVSYFPTITSFLNSITSMMQIYFFPYVSWFLNILPTPIVVALLTYLNVYLLINWYFEPVYKTIITGLEIAKKLPFM